jgi:outer membrane protein
MAKGMYALHAVVLVGLIVLYVLHFNTKQEIVYVDSGKLLNEYKGLVDARASFKLKATTWQANIDTLTSELQASIQKHEKELSGMSAREKQLSEELLGTKQQQLVEYQRALQEKARQEDMQMTQAVIQQLNAYLERYGKSQNYKIIMAATDAGNIVYAQEGMDITRVVLEGLNAEYGK